MTTTFAPGRSARSGFFDRARSAVAGLDWILLLGVAAITAFGLFVVGRSTETDIPGDPRYFLDRQILFVAIGVVLMIVATRVNLDRLARWAWALWGGLLGALAVVFVLGTAVKGSNRWIDIGPFNLQPSEIGKIIMMIVLAGLAVERIQDVGRPRYTLFLTGVIAIPTIVVFLQPDLGTALVYAVILLAILFLVGVPWTHFAVFGSILAIVILGVLWILPHAGRDGAPARTRSSGSRRSSAPSATAATPATSSTRARRPSARAARWARAPDGATQAINDFLPEHHTDFIFAVTSEMFGFVGAGLLISALCARALAGPADARPRLEPDRHAGGGGDRGDDRLPGVR